MVREKTTYGVINKSLLGELFHSSFSSDFKNLIEKEELIATDLIDNNYNILDKKIYYVGGDVHEGIDTYVNLDTDEYSIEPYEWVEHGAWKLKFKIKKRK
jgi:hypothetical protein